MKSAIRGPIPSLLFMVVLSACADGDTPAGDDAPPAPLAITEERDGLWLTDSSGVRRMLTAPRVAGFDFDSLAAKQREGLVILYWAAAPVPSADGRFVAYATNREAVAADTSGQSIWLLDRATDQERALLHAAGRSYRPVAWLADDVVYIGDEPGVWTVDPETGARTALAPGAFVAAAPDGGAVLVADGLPERARLEVVTPSRRVAVPAAPDGFEYLPQAAFEEGGSRIALEAAADSGHTRAHFVFDLRSRELTRIE